MKCNKVKKHLPRVRKWSYVKILTYLLTTHLPKGGAERGVVSTNSSYGFPSFWFLDRTGSDFLPCPNEIKSPSQHCCTFTSSSQASLPQAPCFYLMSLIYSRPQPLRCLLAYILCGQMSNLNTFYGFLSHLALLEKQIPAKTKLHTQDRLSFSSRLY